MGGVQAGPRPAAKKVFDVDAIRRVPGGIASHRATLQVLGPQTPSPAADAPR
ncbi:hypothetical protein SAMN02745121_02257 [Nannocystis exedens]|uniref:Uncharacterized protein n=1 Tax=Nannocystis exedens TaxID=54 RepID=A0A1I1WIJ8_9BACT|nr:hypothetical protein [Nannocystis exedens]PCC67622.1 hypothetical protein NAEX_00629 [Nannocystis exedens]SFD92930.1 hypothetical protein SAMN02745121_02257 [Nannocystis exedens]